MKLTIQKDKLVSLCWAMVAVYATMLLPDMAYADTTTTVGGSVGIAGGTPSALSSVLCTVVSWFTGPIGAGIATLAIIVIGVGALMGKVSWGMAIIVGIGVAVVFGAPSIVATLGGGTAAC